LAQETTVLLFDRLVDAQLVKFIRGVALHRGSVVLITSFLPLVELQATRLSPVERESVFAVPAKDLLELQRLRNEPDTCAAMCVAAAGSPGIMKHFAYVLVPPSSLCMRSLPG
jgi:hypothetical protein